MVIRRDALLSIGCTVGGRQQYFDEESVTEDFATSFRLHAKGWSTDYVIHPYVVGMAPETLTAYFTQHMRWAMGTLAVGLQMARHLVRSPRTLRPGQWWEYLLSAYYFVGVANLIFLIAPGTSVMYAEGKVVIAGGGDPPIATVEDIDLNEATPTWRTVAPMAHKRRHVTGTLLPDGTVLMTGRSSGARPAKSSTSTP